MRELAAQGHEFENVSLTRNVELFDPKKLSPLQSSDSNPFVNPGSLG